MGLDLLENGDSDAAFWFTEFDCQGDLVIWGYRAGGLSGAIRFFRESQFDFKLRQGDEGL